MDECEVYDNDMVNEARDGLDLLLVFVRRVCDLRINMLIYALLGWSLLRRPHHLCCSNITGPIEQLPRRLHIASSRDDYASASADQRNFHRQRPLHRVDLWAIRL